MDKPEARERLALKLLLEGEAIEKRRRQSASLAKRLYETAEEMFPPASVPRSPAGELCLHWCVWFFLKRGLTSLTAPQDSTSNGI
jgi:hypothetical protein